jgi:hypothetical protein
MEVLRYGCPFIEVAGLAPARENDPCSSSSSSSSISSGIGGSTFKVPCGDLSVREISTVRLRMHVIDRPVEISGPAIIEVIIAVPALLSCQIPSILSLPTSGVSQKCSTKWKLRL